MSPNEQMKLDRIKNDLQRGWVIPPGEVAWLCDMVEEGMEELRKGFISAALIKPPSISSDTYLP